MKAYLINPETREVSEVEVDDDNDMKMLHDIYRHMQCNCIEAINPQNADNDIIYLDEIGKSKSNDVFMCRLWPYEPLMGRALWMGCDSRGGNIAPAMTLEYVRAHII